MNIAELQIERLIGPPEDPRLSGYHEAVEAHHEALRRAPGFIWTVKAGEMPELQSSPLDAVFFCVWESARDLEYFSYSAARKTFEVNRAVWFEPVPRERQVIWYLPAGQLPTGADALAKLDLRRLQGDTDAAFGLSYLAGELMRQEQTIPPTEFFGAKK
jgi:hypothetical protein